MTAHSAYDMFYKYLIVNLVFSHLGFWSGIFILIAIFPDHCLLVPLNTSSCVDYGSEMLMDRIVQIV